MKLHHVGYACSDIGVAIDSFQQSHKATSIVGPIFDPLQNAIVCLLEVDEGPNIELVSGDAVKSFLNSDSPALYHTCYEVDDVSEALSKLKSAGYIQVSDIQPAVLFNNRQVVFLKNELGLVELLEVKNNSRQFRSLPSSLTVNITSTFYTGHIDSNLTNIFSTLKLQNTVFAKEIDYVNTGVMALPDDYWQESAINLLLTRVADWAQHGSSDISTAKSFIESAINDLIDFAKRIASLSTYGLTIIICPSIEKEENLERQKLFQDVENKAIKALDKASGINVLTYEVVQQKFNWNPVNRRDSTYGLSQAHKPYTNHYEALLSLSIARQIILLTSPLYKVITVDCDDTLWSGVCAEVSDVEELEITDNHLLLQNFLKLCAKNGYLICLCSKNIEQDVMRVFKKHSKMELSLDDVTSFQVNWVSKTDNLKALAEELNIALESFIVIDNNPLECEEIEQKLPQVLTIRVAEKKEDFNSLINALWFITDKRSSQATQRKNTYKLAAKRNKLIEAETSFASITQKLQLKYNIHWLNSDDRIAIDRVAEMSLRVTQFNCNGGRYSDSDVLSLMKKGWKFLQVSLNDKFGNYGIIATAAIKVDSNCLFIEDIFLSCRAFYKGVEYEILKSAGEFALNSNYDHIIIKYSETVRNIPARQFLSQLYDDGVADKINEHECIIKPKSASCVIPRSALNTLKKPTINNATSTTSNLIGGKEIKLIQKCFSSLPRFIECLREDGEYHPLGNGSLTDKIIKLWQMALKSNTKPHNDSNFFREGGTSLGALEFLAEIYEQFSVSIDFPQFLKSPTIANVINQISASEKLKPDQLPNVIFEDSKRYLATANHQWLWLNRKIEGHTWHYNLPFIFKISGELKVNSFGKAISLVIERHSALKTIFYEEAAVLYQEVNEDFVANVEVIKVSHLASNKIDEIIQKKCCLEFSFDEVPPYQLTLLKFASDSWLPPLSG